MKTTIKYLSDRGPLKVEVGKIENLTTQMLVYEPPSNGGESKTAKFVEFDGAEIQLELPKNVCAVGHHIEFDIYTVNAENDLHLKSTGKILDHERFHDNSIGIRIQLLQFDIAQWKKLEDLFSNKQRELTDLFYLLKGFDDDGQKG